MEKVLIIAYFFPPCNLTASQRPQAWVKYLPEFGYEPIVVTRNWDIEIGNNLDMSRDAGLADKMELIHSASVWHLRYRGNLRDRLFVKFGHQKFRWIRRVLTLFELIAQNWIIRHLPYYNVYKKSRELLLSDSGISKMIITANPFVTFHFGYLLKKEFKRLRWVADYRDDWTTTELIDSRSLVERLVHRMETRSEKKWVSNADCITSISDYYVAKIAAHVNKPGFVVLNGYAEDDKPEVRSAPDASKYIITYTGSLYDSQPIDIFLRAFLTLKEQFANRIELIMQFPGLSYDKKQEARVKDLLRGQLKDVYIAERMSKAEVMKWQKRSNLLLMIGHKGLKGISSSKLYEYISLRKKVLLICNDHDIMESILTNTGLGIICETTDEVIQAVSAEIQSHMLNPAAEIECNEAAIRSYSRKEQVHQLAEILNKL